jgi:hypothetical protein
MSRRYITLQEFFEILCEQMKNWNEEQKGEFRAAWLASIAKREQEKKERLLKMAPATDRVQ